MTTTRRVLLFILTVSIALMYGDYVVVAVEVEHSHDYAHANETVENGHGHQLEQAGQTHDAHEHTEHGGGHGDDDSDEQHEHHHHHHVASSIDASFIVHSAMEDKFFPQVTVDYSQSANLKCPVGPSYGIIKPPQVS